MRMFSSLAISATVVAAASLISQTASAERVCRQECVGPVCQERCVESEGRGDRREERRDEKGERREERREERRDRGPGIELRIPGPDIGR
jgi:hypothetical protein